MVGSQVSAGRQVSVIGFLMTIGLVVFAFIYLFKAAYARDLLWFWPVFDARPVQVEISCRGERILLMGDSALASELTLLVNEQLSARKRFDPLSLSTASMDYFRADPGVVTLEFIYGDPVRVHLPTMYFTGITSLLIPLQGRYASTDVVFGLINDRVSGGSIHVGTIQPLRQAVNASGLCPLP
jgi:hypothetical protein